MSSNAVDTVWRSQYRTACDAESRWTVADVDRLVATAVGVTVGAGSERLVAGPFDTVGAAPEPPLVRALPRGSQPMAASFGATLHTLSSPAVFDDAGHLGLLRVYAEDVGAGAPQSSRFDAFQRTLARHGLAEVRSSPEHLARLGCGGQVVTATYRSAPGRSLLGKSLRTDPIEIVDGAGVTLIAADGARYLDTCSGVVVSALGHRHPRAIEAAVAAAREVTRVHAGSFTTRAVGDLADYLTARSGSLAHAYFMSGGSEIMEVAMKVALQYHVERGESGRRLFVSRRQSYHGSTLGTLALSGNEQRRACFEPALRTTVEFVSPCYQYRDQGADETTDAYVARLAYELDDLLYQLAPGSVAAFVAEPVVGSTSGAVPAVTGYLQAMHAVCRRHGVLLILDEVMCGLGRTGSYFAFHDDEVRPDLVAVGKGLGAGYVPMSALLATAEVVEAIREGSGVLQNGQTHVNNPHGASVALAVQRVVCEEGVLEESRASAAVLRTGLDGLSRSHDLIGDVRGRGMFLGLEFVDPADGSSPLPDPARFASELKRSGFEHGLLLYPGYGTIDGRRGAHLLVAPPLVTSIDETNEMVSRLSAALDTATERWSARHPR